MLDCGGRNYEDGSCVLFSLGNQRPVIFALGERCFVSARVTVLQGLCCISRELILMSAIASALPVIETEAGRSQLTPGHGRGGILRQREKKARRWRCCMGASAGIEASTLALVLPSKDGGDQGECGGAAVRPVCPSATRTTQLNAFCCQWEPPCNTTAELRLHVATKRQRLVQPEAGETQGKENQAVQSKRRERERSKMPQTPPKQHWQHNRATDHFYL